jgi:hypothetical protein
VTVAAGTTVGNSITGPTIEFDPTALIGSPTFSITAGLIHFTTAGDPATSVTVEAGGSLYAPFLLFSVDVPQTLTISGAGVGDHLELGDLTVGGLVSGFSSLLTLNFANASLGAIATQTITDVAWGDEFVVPGARTRRTSCRPRSD